MNVKNRFSNITQCWHNTKGTMILLTQQMTTSDSSADTSSMDDTI